MSVSGHPTILSRFKPCTYTAHFIIERNINWYVYAAVTHRDRKPERGGADSKRYPSISFTRNLNGFAKEIQGTFRTQLVN